MDSEYKKFTIQAKRCIKGEAFFESIISDYAIPHHVSGAKDVGIDYFCEWVHADKPTGVLFAVQVKTFSISGRQSKPKRKGINNGKNCLEIYEIKNSNLKINHSTMSYWRGLAIPVYLFAISEEPDRKLMTAYYKRYTPILTTGTSDASNEEYYKVSEGHHFLAFVNEQAKAGFARDLFIDYMRCTYSKGSIMYLSPSAIGLNQFPEEQNIFPDLFKEYQEKIGETLRLCAQIGRSTPIS